MPQNFLTKITAKRLEKNISQRYMAARLNISQSYYNKLENGKIEMTVNTMLTISEILDIDTTELFPTPSIINQKFETHNS
ncbi:helix-turn-helix domain-containing protein [Flavobacterium terrisoli]|uniref:helix-turn-helix domain-containing protein n=1 Tax=Flavobacterium terrisoli TaxID=3242195 RepID=UPI002543EBFB|nr:helix-turn-helix transcriptional regulator [Flavobacterium buctense]